MSQSAAWGVLAGLVIGSLGAVMSLLGGPLASTVVCATVAALCIGLGHKWKTDVHQQATLATRRSVEATAAALLGSAHGTTALPWSDWALAPDAMLRFLVALRTRDARTVVELGSGVSTVLIAEELRALGRGHVYAVESDERWVLLVQGLVRERGLVAWATVVHAPIGPVVCNGQHYQWYSLDALGKVLALDHIDALLVDGPPRSTGPLARYPALPVLHSRLAPAASIVLDDGHRPDERQIAGMWAREYAIRCHLVESVRGQWELTWQSHRPAEPMPDGADRSSTFA